MTDDLTTRVIEAATDAVRTSPHRLRRRHDLAEQVRRALIREFERVVILDRALDEDPFAYEQALIDALTQLPERRIGAITNEALGRSSLDLDLALTDATSPRSGGGQGDFIKGIRCFR